MKEKTNRNIEPAAPLPDRLRSPAFLMAGIFLFALAVRIVYLIYFRHSPFFDGLIVDAQWHDEWAARWARGDWSMHGRAFFRAPFYPLWLSAVYRIFGHDLLAARIVQALLGAATASALAGCGYEIGGRKTAIAAGIIASLYGTFIFFEGEILIPALLLFLLTWSFFLLLRARRAPGLLLSSFLLGLAVITRPTTIALLPVFAAVFLSKTMSAAITRATAALCLALATLPPLAVTLVNARAEGTFVFIASQGGINFYAGNNPYASGRSVDIPEFSSVQGGWSDFVARTRLAAEASEGRSLASGEVSRYWLKKGLGWMRDEPAAALRLTLKKIYYLMNGFETPNNRSLYLDERFPLNVLLWRIPWLSFPWGLFFPLAAAGAVIGLADEERRRFTRLLILWFISYSALLIPFFVCARFRMALLPAVILLASVAMADPRRLIGTKPLAAFLAAFVIANSCFAGACFESRAQEAAKLGAAHLASGRFAEGRRAIMEAMDADSTSAEYPYLMARSYLMEGRKDEALSYFRRSLEKETRNHLMLEETARILMDMQSYPEAAVALRKALEIRPDAGTWNRLGRLYELLSKPEQAVEVYKQALEAAPSDPRGYLNLGFVYKNLGRTRDAIDAWEKGAKAAPESFGLHFNLALAYAETGDYRKALEQANFASKIDPGHEEAARLRDWLSSKVRSGERPAPK